MKINSNNIMNIDNGIIHYYWNEKKVHSM